MMQVLEVVSDQSLVNVDFAGTPRPQGSGYDIGAYEFGAAPDTTPLAAPTGMAAN